ncbi:MAG: hypothetical protein MR497_03030 [Bacilli bacterium]|nr:hypothetical protein [Bacilli bacterium]
MCCQLVRSICLLLGSCSLSHDFAIASFHAPSLVYDLQVAIKFVGNYTSWDFHPRYITCPSYNKKV